MTSHSNFQFLPVPKSIRCTILKKNMATSLSSNVNSRRATNTLNVMMIIQQSLQSGVRSILQAVYYKAANLFHTRWHCVLSIVSSWKSKHCWSQQRGGDRKSVLYYGRGYDWMLQEISGDSSFKMILSWKVFRVKLNLFWLLKSKLHFFDRIPCILVTAKGYPDVTTRRCSWISWMWNSRFQYLVLKHPY